MSTQEDEADLDFDDEEDDEEDDDEDWDPDESVEGKRLQRLLLMSVAASRRMILLHISSPLLPRHAKVDVSAFRHHFSIWPMPVKEMQVDGLEDKACPTVINRTNWIGDEGYNYNSMRMRFKVLQSGNHLRVSIT